MSLLPPTSRHLHQGPPIIRQAIETYLDEIEDLRCGVTALKDPADPWQRSELVILVVRIGHRRELYR